MSFNSLEAAAHVLPNCWDFTLSGVWTCPDCEHSWRSRVEFDVAKAHLADLRARAADENDDALKDLTALLKAHAATHMDATLLEAPIVRMGTEAYKVDPMHCLELNLAKTAWKHSFGIRMLPHHRERVAAYLDSIGCVLDIREKGKRDIQQKWFSASTVDEYVC
eukprot:474892-Pleurochrysis_carterae.AAC.1